MTGTPLVAVAHGSRDARSAATVHRLAEEAGARSGLDVRVAFLDLSEPSVPDVLASLHDEGHREVVVVPLLLGSAYHARVDLPELLNEVQGHLPLLHVRCADVLGPDPLLEAAALNRLAAAGALTAGDPAGELGVVLAGVGSAHAPANAAIARVAANWRHGGRFASVTHAFATCTPDVGTAIARLRARGARRVAVAPWFLAPGLLLDQIAVHARGADPGVLIADPLGAHPLVAELVLQRYSEARATGERAA